MFVRGAYINTPMIYPGTKFQGRMTSPSDVIGIFIEILKFFKIFMDVTSECVYFRDYWCSDACECCFPVWRKRNKLHFKRLLEFLGVFIAKL